MIALLTVLVCTAAAAADNASSDERDQRQPYPVQNNVYMVSLVPPEVALKQGFPESELPDHVQTFLAGVPERDASNIAAFQVAFSRFGAAAGLAWLLSTERSVPAYVYAIAGDAYWYRISTTANAMRRSRASALLAEAAQTVDLTWMRRIRIYPDLISYVVGFNHRQTVEIRAHNLRNGNLYENQAYPGTRSQTYYPDLQLNVVRLTDPSLLTFNLACPVSGPSYSSTRSALASTSTDRCNPANINTMPESTYIARYTLPLLTAFDDD
ncbi:MAG: hypothetical protein JHC61_13135 [Burkholderiaceae bacterium]|nr:hypothetical protein [Burkholderiaceae bacterium]